MKRQHKGKGKINPPKGGANFVSYDAKNNGMPFTDIPFSLSV